MASSTLVISWPYEVENGHPQGKHLLYLLDPPKVRQSATNALKYFQIYKVAVAVAAAASKTRPFETHSK